MRTYPYKPESFFIDRYRACRDTQVATNCDKKSNYEVSDPAAKHKAPVFRSLFTPRHSMFVVGPISLINLTLNLTVRLMRFIRLPAISLLTSP